MSDTNRSQPPAGSADRPTGKVAVGSLNPVKVDAVREGFTKRYPDIEWIVTGWDVQSGVSDQPMSDHEALAGARARAVRAGWVGDADFAVGLEAALSRSDGEWFSAGWVVVIETRDYFCGRAGTLRVPVSEDLMTLVRAGRELGSAVDKQYGLTGSKQNGGHVGVVTDSTITREAVFADAVVVALSALTLERATPMPHGRALAHG